MNDYSVTLSPNQAQLVAAELNEAGMEVTVQDHFGGPMWIGRCVSGAVVLSAIMTLIARGELPFALLSASWQMVAFEEKSPTGFAHETWCSAELGWS